MYLQADLKHTMEPRLASSLPSSCLSLLSAGLESIFKKKESSKNHKKEPSRNSGAKEYNV
jgi:hypothetical protein